MSFVKIEVLVTDRELTVSETWLNITVNLLHGSSLLVAEFLFGIRVRKDWFVVESTRQSSLRLQKDIQNAVQIPEKDQRVPWLNIILFFWCPQLVLMMILEWFTTCKYGITLSCCLSGFSQTLKKIWKLVSYLDSDFCWLGGDGLGGLEMVESLVE